jgi:hypothetical protein
LCQADHEAINDADTLERSLARADTLRKPEEQRSGSYRTCNNKWRTHRTFKEIASCEAEKNGGDGADNNRKDEALVGGIATVASP